VVERRLERKNSSCLYEDKGKTRNYRYNGAFSDCGPLDPKILAQNSTEAS
jgi:hypothetical protein